MKSELPEGTGSDTSLAAAGTAINSLLSALEKVPEDKETDETPRTPAADEVEDTTEPAEVDDTEPESTDEEEDDEDEEEQEPATPALRKLKVKLPDGEQELPEDEVVKGYLRNADYTRKTQELAEKRKAQEAEIQAVAAERQRYATQLAQLETLLTDSAGDEPDWDTLRGEDPAVFAATYAAWDQHQKRIAQVKAERVRAQQQVLADQATQLQEHLKGEAAKLVESIPEWKDAEKAKTDQAAIVEYARSQGYTDAELNAVADHRVIKILRDAMLHRQAQSKKPAIEKKIEKARVLAPGSSAESKREVSELTRKKQRLAKSHSARDAGDAIALLID